MLNKVRLVLVATTHPGNIGAAARAMKTMGLMRLYLVNPKDFPNVEATARAAGADDLLANAVVVSDLEQALVGCSLVFGTSARLREMPIQLFDPREAAQRICHAALADNEVAVVFGQENNGLSNEHLLRCNYHINIPANTDFSSLNIAAAVQIIAYELSVASSSFVAQHKTAQPEIYDVLATHDEVAMLYDHLAKTLTAIDFLLPDKSRKLMPRLRRLFNRTHLEKMELNILRGILTAIDHKLALNKEQN